TKNIDLFVIDEAHNLRSKSGSRHDAVLDLLQQHPDARILLLTATPINNSLMDIANQIQLASKGRRVSVNVPYVRPNSKDTEMLDFFEALKRIQTLIKKAERSGEDVENILNVVKPTIHAGLRHYLVRSTRQGVEAEGGIIDKTGEKKAFPTSIVESIEYKYQGDITSKIYDTIGQSVDIAFEGLDPRHLNLLLMSEFTQQTSHPLDFINRFNSNPDYMYEMFSLPDNITDELGNLFLKDSVKTLVPNILQCVFMLGFAPYKPESYKHDYYDKTVEEIRALQDVPDNLRIQLSVHNILQVTWLKRMESSASALLSSIENYRWRIDLFEKYLDIGYIVNLSEASLLESDYNDGADIDQAFDDYEEYLRKKEQLIAEGKDDSELKKYGVERRIANPKIYNIDQIKKDIMRDKKILQLLSELLQSITLPEHDTKMQNLVKHLKKVLSSRKYGKKVVVFSFFADTINYLRDNLKDVIAGSIPDFEYRSAFIHGHAQDTEKIVRRFSPKAKKYKIKPEENEIDFLFSTDILSEGQNLQDAGYLINYDLHWNPVRMIQRNGRINRLGSDYSDVLIANMKPTDELEVYLRLVNRLERKIKTIRNTVGLDQGVLTSRDVNPIEFIEKYYEDGTLPEPDDDLLADSDEHIIALRTFLAENSENQQYIERIKNMPKGKWNYLPQKSHHPNSSIALVRAIGKTKETEKTISELFFVDVKCQDEYVATYLEYNQALDLIKTAPDDNDSSLDQIDIDRLKVISRSKAEAKRQANNPETIYKIKPSFEKALIVLSEYFDTRVDLKGTIEQGVTTIDLEKELERVLRRVIKEIKKDGTVYPGTIKSFEKIFKKIQENTSEGKVIQEVEGVLYYADKPDQS
ncbi:MAG: helicase-related protein, partial [bacterium]